MTSILPDFFFSPLCDRNGLHYLAGKMTRRHTTGKPGMHGLGGPIHGGGKYFFLDRPSYYTNGAAFFYTDEVQNAR